ncbi:RagB/SusD family nutrient uptake outer membrane protein [Flavivirga amylovorans]|uniref:RagB/SusD family nutrient uptake outer membrane protein n=1 Tax=Flavivirga amylovorans TaxID=870486 RepID=A0ABT8X2J0_9FLAO|nr:RagB/SusD family nutrient uptake outer membrane protein [Flavivirga amylovorans]MDO5988172.1 RagB/SusD family nutrient uptake outer membrane protein [Flavivirga amylovorans]
MKKYIKNIEKVKYFFCAILLTLTFSCDDDLDPKNFGQPVVEDFYKTPEQAEQALVSAYSSMRELYGSNFWGTMGTDIIFGEIGTDDFIKGGRTATNNAPLLEKERYAFTTSNPIFEELWSVNYEGILFANLVLANVPNIEFDDDDDRQQEILAEASFLRALYYFDLVNSFGGVPLVERPLEISEFNQPRASKEDVYQLIERDLQFAIDNLPSRFNKDSDYLGRADKGAALGLMMRVLLYQNKNDQIRSFGDQLFALNYSLTSDYSTIFQPEGEWNSGSIFEINFVTDANVLGTGIPRRVNPNNNTGGGFVQAKEDLRNEYEANDPRLDATLFFSDRPYGTDWYVRKYAWEPFTNYPKPDIGGNSNSSNNVRLIRLSDVYLMYAEAVYDSDPATAIDYVNRVRRRARGTQPATVLPDLDPTLVGQPLLDAIYHERRVELAGEGFRFHDLVRTGRASTLLAPLGFIEGTHEVVPLPVQQVTLSKGVLIQNPNY